MTQSHRGSQSSSGMDRVRFVPRAWRALRARHTVGTALPVEVKPCFMMKHEISTAGIFVPKPSGKEARRVKADPPTPFKKKSKTGNAEEQQPGQIRGKKNEHIPVSQGSDLPAGALLNSTWIPLAATTSHAILDFGVCEGN